MAVDYEAVAKTLAGIGPLSGGSLMDMFNKLKTVGVLPNGGSVSSFYGKGKSVQVGVEVDLLDLFAVSQVGIPFFPGLNLKVGFKAQLNASKQGRMAIEQFPSKIYPFIFKQHSQPDTEGKSDIEYTIGENPKIISKPIGLLVLKGNSRSVDISLTGSASGDIGKTIPLIVDELGVSLSATIDGSIGVDGKFSRLSDWWPEFYASSQDISLITEQNIEDTISTYSLYHDQENIKEEIRKSIMILIDQWITPSKQVPDSKRKRIFNPIKDRLHSTNSRPPTCEDWIKHWKTKPPKTTDELYSQLQTLKRCFEEHGAKNGISPAEKQKIEENLKTIRYYRNLLFKLQHPKNATQKTYRHYLTYFRSLSFGGKFSVGTDSVAKVNFGISSKSPEAKAAAKLAGDYQVSNYRFQSFNEYASPYLVHTQDSWQTFRRLAWEKEASAQFANYSKGTTSAKTYNTLTYRAACFYWKYDPKSLSNLAELEMGSGLTYGLSVSYTVLKECTTPADKLIQNIANQLRVSKEEVWQFVQESKVTNEKADMPTHIFFESGFNFKPKTEVRLDGVIEEEGSGGRRLKRIIRKVKSKAKEKVTGVAPPEADPIYMEIEQAFASETIKKFRERLGKELQGGEERDNLLSTLRIRIRLSDVNQHITGKFKLGTSQIPISTPISVDVGAEKYVETGQEVMFDYFVKVFDNTHYGSRLNSENCVPPTIIF